jgi:hypothetical protein
MASTLRGAMAGLNFDIRAWDLKKEKKDKVKKSQ